MTDALLLVLFAANAIWFGMAFNAFYVRRKVFAKVLLPVREDRDNTAYETVIESGRFMGGFNLVLSLFNIALLFNWGGFETAQQWALVLIFNALAHGSQFAGNVPMYLQNRRGEGLWPVLKGVMKLIFVLDFTLMVANALLAAAMIAGR